VEVEAGQTVLDQQGKALGRARVQTPSKSLELWRHVTDYSRGAGGPDYVEAEPPKSVY